MEKNIDTLTDEQRLSEVAGILAAGIIRFKERQKQSKSAPSGRDSFYQPRGNAMTDVITINEVIQIVKVEDKRINVVTVGTQGPPGTGGGGGSSDHGSLTGLSDDDHPHYHNDARGDVRYYTKAQVDSSLTGKANTAHGHAIADVSGLQTALDGKAADSHGHGIADVSGLQSALDGKLDASFAALIPKMEQTTVDFGNASGGEGDLAIVTVAAAWVTNGSVILCNAAGKLGAF